MFNRLCPKRDEITVLSGQTLILPEKSKIFLFATTA